MATRLFSSSAGVRLWDLNCGGFYLVVESGTIQRIQAEAYHARRKVHACSGGPDKEHPAPRWERSSEKYFTSCSDRSTEEARGRQLSGLFLFSCASAVWHASPLPVQSAPAEASVKKPAASFDHGQTVSQHDRVAFDDTCAE